MTTAIIFFSRLPKTEAIFKKLSHTASVNEKLIQSLYAHSLNIAKVTNYPLITFTENNQRGNSFAEKITNAAEAVFNMGYQNIIIIGADTPNLKKAHILNAQKALNGGNMIVADPDKKGGIFLLGINKQIFNKQIFLNFGWQTNNLFINIKKYGAAFTHQFSRYYLQDINNEKDAILAATAFYDNTFWRKTFFSLVKPLHYFLSNGFIFIKSLLHKPLFGLRAPPAYINF